MKRTSLFKQLLLNISIPLIIGLLTLSFYNYSANKSKLEQTNKWQRKIIFNQVKDVMDIYDTGMSLFEKNFDSRMKQISKQVLNTYSGKLSELKKADLEQLSLDLDIDTNSEDLYIIDRNYIVLNTTFKKDLGLNFKQRSPDSVTFFDSIFKIDNCLVDRFTTERITGRLKKYSYQPSVDKKFILEMGFVSGEAISYENKMKRMIRAIEKMFPEVKSVELFQAREGFVHFAANPKIKDLFIEVLKTKKTQRKEIKSQNKTEYFDLMYLPMKNSLMFDGYVIQIISDDSQMKEMVLNEVWKSILLFLCTLIPLVFILAYRADKITKPIKILSEKSKLISRGNFNEHIEIKGNNEITELSENFNLMVHELQESYSSLESKVEQRTTEVVQQKHLVEEKHKEITDSINYAKRIQSAILPSEKLIKSNFPNSFILYKPKDIVAGDFYWFEVIDDLIFFAAADCTGHGVPGALVSVVCHNALNRSVKEFKLKSTSDILDKTREIVISEFEKSDEDVKDGMDISLCVLDKKSLTLSWAGAHNPLWILRNEEILETKADKQPIGKFAHAKPFSNHKIQLFDKDEIYISTDGFQDQFGGEKGKKFKASQLKEILIVNKHKTMEEKLNLLNQAFEKWKGDLEQVDDVCVIGVKV